MDFIASGFSKDELVLIKRALEFDIVSKVKSLGHLSVDEEKDLLDKVNQMININFK